MTGPQRQLVLGWRTRQDSEELNWSCSGGSIDVHQATTIVWPLEQSGLGKAHETALHWIRSFSVNTDREFGDNPDRNRRRFRYRLKQIQNPFNKSRKPVRITTRPAIHDLCYIIINDRRGFGNPNNSR